MPSQFRSGRARIAVVKPDYGVAGGFEYLLDRLLAELVELGHSVEPVPIPGRQSPRPIWGQTDAASRWFDHPEFFNYLGMVHDTRRLELDDFDLVLSTQPPSYLAPHPRILGLFYHQARVFYELEEPYIAAGFIDGDRHRAAARHVRAVDRAHLSGVVHWLAGSHEAAARIRTAWQPTPPISLLDAPPLSAGSDPEPSWDPAGPVLCVSRHEWPKRTELVVAAGHLLQRPTHLIGGGGRLDHVCRLDRMLAEHPDRASSIGSVEAPASSPWLGAVAASAGPALRNLFDRVRRNPPASPVRLLGPTPDEDRDDAYRRASVVVAPAYREDYGLTALEAMSWGCPVVVCRDGGGLVELVEATGAGLVVEPTASAIAEGVRSIIHDHALGADLVERALSVRSSHTWDRARSQLLHAVDSILQ